MINWKNRALWILSHNSFWRTILPLLWAPSSFPNWAWNILVDKFVTDLAWQEDVGMEPECFVVQEVAESPLQVAKAVIGAQGHQWLGTVGRHFEGNYGKEKSRRKLLMQEILPSNEVLGWSYGAIRTAISREGKKDALRKAQLQVSHKAATPAGCLLYLQPITCWPQKDLQQSGLSGSVPLIPWYSHSKGILWEWVSVMCLEMRLHSKMLPHCRVIWLTKALGKGSGRSHIVWFPSERVG